MKKIVALLMILCSLFLWGCGKDNATQSANKDEALKIEMLDIGQGDATLIQTKEQTIMIDTGDIDERDNLVKLLYYTDHDPFSHPALTEEEKQEKVFSKLIKFIPLVGPKETDNSIIVLRVASAKNIQ